MMAGHRRPLFVLYGASMVEYSFRPEGWGAALTNIYSRQADVLLRGYRGWNTRRAVAALETIFPKNSPIQPSLVVLFFGTNDAAFPLPSGQGQHVPIHEYKDNLRHICSYILGLSDTTRLILIAPPPIYEDARRTFASDGMHLSAEGGKILLEELLTVIKSENWVPSIVAEHMASDFAEPSPYDMIHPYLETAQHCDGTTML